MSNDRLLAKALIVSGDIDVIRKAMKGEVDPVEAMRLVAPSHLRPDGEIGRRLPQGWSAADHALFIALAILRDRP